MKKFSYYMLLLLLFTTCVKPFDYEADGSVTLLVIDGQITDEAGPYTINISYSYGLNADTLLAEANAEVWLLEDENNTISLAYTDSGRYVTPSTFQAQVGHSYQLHVSLNGQEYASSTETLQTSPGIDSIYQQYDQQASTDGTQNVGGIQVFVKTNEDAAAKYFRFEYEEDYQIQAPYPSIYEVEDDTLVLAEYPRGYCYSHLASTEVILGTTIGTSVNQLIDFPVTFVKETEQQLRYHYSIKVTQYTIDKKAYDYNQLLKESNEGSGTLFDKQLGTVQGNLYNVNDPDELVLGYFEVAGTSSKRVFYLRKELDERLALSQYPVICIPEDIRKMGMSAIVRLMQTSDTHNAFRIETNEEGETTVWVHTAGCTDCTTIATNIPPDFWPQ